MIWSDCTSDKDVKVVPFELIKTKGHSLFVKKLWTFGVCLRQETLIQFCSHRAIWNGVIWCKDTEPFRKYEYQPTQRCRLHSKFAGLSLWRILRLLILHQIERSDGRSAF